SVPGAGYGIIVQKVETEDGSMVEKGINFVFVDNDYLDTMEMEVIQGRNFNPELQTDLEEAILINEAAARILGYGEEAIGKKIEFGVNPDGDPVRSTRVIGVVKDFHYASLHNPVDPILILLADSPLRNLSLRISGDNVAGTIDYIREKWTEFCPTFPFEYTFLEDNLNDLYIAEQKIAKVFTYFALVSIFIACLGLFGLAAYTANQRTKEIGIRKVMGANVTNISTLLAVEFTKWVLIANIIAWPVAYFALQKWLDNFAYQIDITKNIGIFIVSGCIAIAIAIITVSFQAIKAALANPIDALKYE
ncbi:MAG: ABC transporter permease, partial [Candidatus Cloacimonetes bacterium]|nr:ABC transporter permease [Candidatus Cloacimonadota bacterium]